MPAKRAFARCSLRSPQIGELALRLNGDMLRLADLLRGESHIGLVLLDSFSCRHEKLSSTRGGEHSLSVCRTTDYEWSPLFLRDSRVSETRARVKITPRETRDVVILLSLTASLLSRMALFSHALAFCAFYYP